MGQGRQCKNERPLGAAEEQLMIMALDLGDARTGVAFSDPMELLPGRAYTVAEHNKERLLATGMNPRSRRYTPAQVRLIVEVLEEP